MEFLSFILFNNCEKKMKWWFFEQYIYAVNIADRNTIDMINKDKLRTEHQVISAFILLTTTWRHHAYSLFSYFLFFSSCVQLENPLHL